jgi:predicted nucleic acid-binding protein
MTTICVDASFMIRLVTKPPIASPYLALWKQWIASGVDIVAPSLLFYEMVNGLYRQVLANNLLPEDAEQLLQAALMFPIRFCQDNSLHQRAYSLAQELNLSATYDAHYLALSEQLSAEFWTCDRRLFNTVQATLSWIHLVTE